MHILHTLTIHYLTDIRAQRAQSYATEELSYRDALGNFLRAAAAALGKTATFTGEPQKITFGRPDYAVTNGLKVIGYVEAEALSTDLGKLKGHAKEQNERFRANLHNFLQTNHFDFRLFVDGELNASASLPEPKEQGKIMVPDAELDHLQKVLETFLDGATPAAVTPNAIALQLARRARFLRVAADAMLSNQTSPLHSLWNLYRESLFADISAEKFADVYAQTFTYGLFLAWLNTNKSTFDRTTALHAIPDAVPPIQVLLEFGGGRRLPDAFKWIIDGICADLDAADKESATKHEAGIADPLVSFYETFLKAYDPELRDRAGVFYTPDAVVDFIVRAVDDLLRRDFGKDKGLADKTVRLLDPATGTATFLARAYQQVRHTMIENGDGDLWPDRARSHVMQHFYGFERLPAAYTLAHVKLRQLLAESSVCLSETDRLPVYLADTMMNKIPEQGSLPGADVLSEESREAARVRDQEDVLVVIGNPPYNVKSDNPSKDSLGAPTFIGDLIQTYYKIDGQPLGERNPKSLQDDYVKFIRFAQWRVDRTGKGIVAFITNNSYLDNPTFRGMRRSLMQTFNEIYIIDLHGNSNKKERSPDGSKDINVFDIQQGVAIALFIKTGVKVQSSIIEIIHHSDIYGTRQSKYDKLNEIGLVSMNWERIFPNHPFYLFRPQNQDVRQEYEEYVSITEVFQKNVGGITTGRDHFAIDINKESLQTRITNFRDHGKTDDEISIRYDLENSPSWSIETARRRVQQDKNWKSRFHTCIHRPFDMRHIYYSDFVVDRSRRQILQNLLQENYALILPRQTKEEWGALVTNTLCTHKIVTVYDRSFVFPLWQYPTETETAMGLEREANINPAFLARLSQKIGQSPTPENTFFYTYAVFYAPTYRTRYAAFLKTDFPRLPLPPDADTFNTLAALGAKLTALHLLEDAILKQHGIGYKGGGSHVVKKMREADRYIRPAREGETGRIRLNDSEYFDNVPPEAWEFQVGGYRPAAKWLDDRKDRALTEDDIAHYRRMIAAMRDTVALLPAVDAAFGAILTAQELGTLE